MSSSSAHSDIPSVVRSRTVTHSPRRLSVFGGRSRSNTATSSSSSYKSPASSMTSVEAPSQRSSQDDRTLSNPVAPADKQDGAAKSLLSRGSRILRRQGSKFSISSNLTLEEEDEMARGNHHASHSSRDKLDGLGIFYRSHRARHSDMHDLLKKNISDPFDFQHVTHTSQSQLPPLDNSHLNDIATEFSVIRASQRPGAELKGIRAENLHFQNFSSDDISARYDASSPPDSRSLYTRSPPRSPDARTSPKSPNKLVSGRNSRSVENFSRPVSRLSRQKSSSPSIIPPPRTSSKLATPDIPEPSPQTIDALLGLHATTPDSLYEDRLESPLPKLDLPCVFPEVGSALTTEGDTAKALSPPPTATSHSFDLADVPEEEEPAPSKTDDAPGAVSPPAPEGPFRFGQSTPRVKLDKPLPAVPLFNDDIPGPEALGSPTIPTNRTYGDFPSREVKKRQSIIPRPADDLSWEDDIDYCYEHAAESDSNFDWQRTSFEEPELRSRLRNITIEEVPEAEEPQQEDHQASTPQAEPETERPIESAPQHKAEQSDETIVHFGPASAPITSSPKEDVSAVARKSASDCIQPGILRQSGYFKPDHIPILSAPFDDDMSSDNAYGGLIPTEHGYEGHFPFYPQVDEQFDSSRDSCSPISKCNSQESIILSRAASIARKHRSSLSFTSVPELVHSSSCSHEAVDRDSMSSAGDRSKQNFPACTSRPPSTTTHQRSKSLARELQRPVPIICSNFPDEHSDVSPLAMTPLHDRAKSVSALDMHESMKAKAPETRKRSATITRGPSGRKGRKSYSLFPTAPAAAPASAPVSR
ncbi:hypothetical protein FQN50_006998 [Emmonsiellopsis sp. PD_5]|nr:hypothetical protein FQN50_006998 [Emmonsiellopsis sp. PD_5]